MMSIGAALVFFSVGVMPVCIEVFFFSSCDERQMFLNCGVVFDVWPWVFCGFFAGLDGWVFREILALSAICR